MNYREVFLSPTTDKNIIKVYGESRVGPILLPEGENGRDIWNRGKLMQTELGKLECLKKGSECIETT